MTTIERSYLSIKHPIALSELDTYLANLNNPTSTLKAVAKSDYVAALADAGEGMHIDAIVTAVHGCQKGSGLFLPNKKRTSTWLNQNSSEIVKKGVAGVVEKVDSINGKEALATYKLTDAALKEYIKEYKTSASDDLESMSASTPLGEAKPDASNGAKAKAGKRETVNA